MNMPDPASDGLAPQAPGDGVAAPPGRLPTALVVLRNPLVRIVLFILFAAALGYLGRQLLPPGAKGPGEALSLQGGALWLHLLRSVLPPLLAYVLLVRLVEARPLHELRPRRAARDIALGWLLGTAILLLAAGAMVAAGALDLSVATTPAQLLTPLVVAGLAPGIGEEIVARGLLFRVVEDGLGTWGALLVSSAFFGLAHIANPNATAWTSIAIAIEAGLLLGMAYAWTRSLWFVMALHAAWNFTQGAILGIPVSGMEVHGLMAATPKGNPLLSGGEFGAEGSILTVVLCTVIAAWFTRRALADRRVVGPFWRRDRLAWPASKAGVMEARAADAERLALADASARAAG
jgi:membrane protease YdiL (CAAX protease family)